MNPIKTITSDKFLWTGWAAVVLSSLLFCVPLLTIVSTEHYVGLFALHFGIAVVYHFVLYLNKSQQLPEHRLYYRLTKLVLLLISAYALNRDMEVFAASPVWFSVVLTTICVNALSSAVFHYMPAWLQQVSMFLQGIAFLVFAYLAIYLLPLYLVSIPGLLILGISIHTFIPLLFCVAIIVLMTRLSKRNPRYWIGFVSGLITVAIVCAGFTISWDNHVQRINNRYANAMSEGEDGLPLWVQVAQEVDRDAVTEAILKTGLIYKASDWNDGIFWRIPSRNFGDQQQLHDPLVTLASMFTSKVMLSESDRIKILESQYNARHQALERLWSGEDLRTEQVTTHAKVWPASHLAYTEKTLTVYNHQSPQRWNASGEGIYTFHLPEGAVVTSLSLWINGREEKGILTTKEKAARAYGTIVGYERRDPSVVHWQEGNTVSVRVFPVMAGESRTFKIGITAPLRREGLRLVYDNIWFDGPDARNATETVKVEVADDTKSLIRQAALKTTNGRTVTRSGRYQPIWTAAFKDGGLASRFFAFNGNRYSMQPYKPQRVPMKIEDVYLDINQQWTEAELQQVWKLLQGKRIWAYNHQMIALDESNKQEILSLLRQQSFSLFPFHLIPNREQAMVISKSGLYSPNMADLEGSDFLKRLHSKLQPQNRIRLFHLGEEISPYLRSLKERRCFDFEMGNTELLQFILTKNLFVQDVENDNQIVLHSARAVITKESGDASSTAPDHLLRLFAYNHILQQLGRQDPTNLTDSTALIKEAQEAYVVSPVSSLVVLETQKDYDRFDIADSKNSLKNASLKNNGAVPEPGEWAIIIVLIAAFVGFVYKTKFI